MYKLKIRADKPLGSVAFNIGRVIKINTERYLNEMANHLLNNNLIFFIGAGFSNILEYPNWGNLLNDIIRKYQLKDKLRETSLFTFIDKSKFDNADGINDEILEKLIGADYLRLAGYIDFMLKSDHSTSIHEEIYKEIQECEKERIKNKDSEVIMDFFSRHRENIDEIITTNYDSNIEFCLEGNVSVVNRNLESLNDLHNKVKLYKIHGCIKDEFYSEEGMKGNNIIITEKDYNNFRINNKYLFYKMYSLFIEKKIVFIGYSINDPNIRSILNDVIEETNNKVNLKIYWINRDKVDSLDKKYYENYFKIDILENQEIIEFIKNLDERIYVNKDLRQIRDAGIEEYSEKFVFNYNDSAYICDIRDNNKAEEIYKYIYTQMMEEPLGYYVKPYFKLIKEYGIDIWENKLSIQNILEQQNTNIFYIVETLYEDKDLYGILDELGLVDILIKSVIEYTQRSHAFGEYARSIKALLFLYDLTGERIVSYKEKLIDALSGNIRKSTSRSLMRYGYDWSGLEVVEEYIYLLKEEDVLDLINDVDIGYTDEMNKLQINKVIQHSNLSEAKKKELIYKFLIIPESRKEFKNIIGKVLKEYDYKQEVGGYVDSKGLRLLKVKCVVNQDIVEHIVINQNDNNEEILKIIQEYIPDTIEIIIGDEKLNFESLKGIKENHKEIEEYIKEYFGDKLK